MVIGKAVYDLASHASQKSVTDALEERFLKVEVQMPETPPKRPDEITTQMEVAQIIYTTKLDLEAYQIDEGIRQRMREYVIASVCSKDEMTKTFEYGTVYRYIYQDTKDNFVTSFDVDQKNCATVPASSAALRNRTTNGPPVNFSDLIPKQKTRALSNIALEGEFGDFYRNLYPNMP
jgi:hypothetical protein